MNFRYVHALFPVEANEKSFADGCRWRKVNCIIETFFPSFISSLDKSRVLSLLLHSCDVSHPAKNWNIHHQWTSRCMEEFFKQGDIEKKRGLEFSPLCDRHNTMVPQSQIGKTEGSSRTCFTHYSKFDRFHRLYCESNSAHMWRYGGSSFRWNIHLRSTLDTNIRNK